MKNSKFISVDIDCRTQYKNHTEEINKLLVFYNCFAGLSDDNKLCISRCNLLHLFILICINWKLNYL